MENQFKGTKGNWHLTDWETVVDEQGFGVCQEYGINNGSKWLANAALISCAPEMLEMLKFIYDAVDWSTEAWENNAGQKHKSEMEQLIKKATTI